MKKLKEELTGMRTRLEELRVQGNLGKMELKDKLAEFKEAFDPAYAKAKKALTEFTQSGVEESRALAKSLRAGWDELRETHQELLDEAERKRKEAHDAKRRGES